MKITSAKFVKSSSREDQCPEGLIPEFAFIGRSNVGKSSLINCITNQTKLAMTSSRPGKTQLINHFLINNKWHLVDLPGYGYAIISKKSREAWLRMIRYYIQNRKNLLYIFVLIDSRVPPQELDIEFINWLGSKNIPFVLVFTKCDKTKQTEQTKLVKDIHAKLSDNWETMPHHIFTSSEKGRGKDEILDFIGNSLKDFGHLVEIDGILPEKI